MKTITSLSIALMMLMLTGILIHPAQVESAEVPSEVHYIVADTQDQAAFTTTGANDRYLLMGFGSTPIIMDVTDEEDPFLLYGYEQFDMNGEVGAYLAYPGQAVCLAVGFDSVTEIDAIDMN